MRILEMIGHALRGVRSAETKMISAENSTATETFLKVSSSAFDDEQPMPVRFTMDGENLFPGLQWSQIPEGTKSLVLVVEDPDIPKSTPFVHGIVYNIPPTLSSLPTEAFVDGELARDWSIEGVACGGNSMGQAKYMAPSPPPGHGVHHYFFQLFALDKELEFSKAPDLDDIKKAISNHVIAYGETVGTYERV
jgi:Raf kinase inhibitor-like YbhB/YbcL family protein